MHGQYGYSLIRMALPLCMHRCTVCRLHAFANWQVAHPGVFVRFCMWCTFVRVCTITHVYFLHEHIRTYM